MLRFPNLAVVLGLAGAAVCAVSAQAQYVTYYRPAIQPTVAYYAPAPVIAPVSYAVAAPVPYTVGYGMAAPVLAAPVVAPAPVVTYYRAPTVAYAPVPQVVTRYRPILGGSVSRVRYTYMPVILP